MTDSFHHHTAAQPFPQDLLAKLPAFYRADLSLYLDRARIFQHVVCSFGARAKELPKRPSTLVALFWLIQQGEACSGGYLRLERPSDQAVRETLGLGKRGPWQIWRDLEAAGIVVEHPDRPGWIRIYGAPIEPGQCAQASLFDPRDRAGFESESDEKSRDRAESAGYSDPDTLRDRATFLRERATQPARSRDSSGDGLYTRTRASRSFDDLTDLRHDDDVVARADGADPRDRAAKLEAALRALGLGNPATIARCLAVEGLTVEAVRWCGKEAARKERERTWLVPGLAATKILDGDWRAITLKPARPAALATAVAPADGAADRQAELDAINAAIAASAPEALALAMRRAIETAPTAIQAQRWGQQNPPVDQSFKRAVFTVLQAEKNGAGAGRAGTDH